MDTERAWLESRDTDLARAILLDLARCPCCDILVSHCDSGVELTHTTELWSWRQRVRFALTETRLMVAWARGLHA